jgi:hypothetical protein
MKVNRFISISSLFIAASVWGHDPGNLTPVEEVNYTCGYAHVLAHQERAIRTTQALHPEWERTLHKQSDTQYEVGDSLLFYTYNYKTNSFDKTMALCRFKGNNTYIFVGKDEWGTEKVTDTHIQAFHQGFDVSTPAGSVNPAVGIRQNVEDTFGKAPNKTGDGYVYILIYDIKETTETPSYTAGYFMPNDQTDGSFSNRKDLLYIDCSPGNPGSSRTLAIIAHEFQHLIHYGADRDEDNGGTWVNEGASEYASVVCGYSLRSPTKYLRNPARSLLTFDYDDETLIDYEKVALWTYYLGDHYGPTLIGEIVRQPENSVAGVRAALLKKGISQSFEEIYANFVLANYLDNNRLHPQGYYGYKKITMPLVTPSAEYSSYPVSTKIKDLASYAGQYFRFSGQDSTARLTVASTAKEQMKTLIINCGSDTTIEQLVFDANGETTKSLRTIGKTVKNIVLAPVNMSGNNSVYYQVSSNLIDVKAPLITSGPIESIPGGSSVTIFWETDEYSSSIVEYGASTYSRQVVDSAMTTEHRVALTGLSANTTYHYRVGSADAKKNGPTYSADFTFTTLTQTGKKIVTLQQSHSYGYLGRSLVTDPNQVIHFIYHEKTTEDRFIYHQQSADQGVTWSAPQPIDYTLISGGMPSIACDSLGRLHVCWHAKSSATANYQIFYSRSDDQGKTFTSPKQVSSLLPNNDQLYSAIAIDRQNNPHIVWNSGLYDDSFIGDVYHAWSQDNGATWVKDAMISQSTLHQCFAATIDFDSQGRCHVAFSDGNWDASTLNPYYVWSDDYTTWEAPIQVGHSGVMYDGIVALLVDAQDRVHITYSDNYVPGDIRIMHGTFLKTETTPFKPIAASTLGINGFVYSPQLSCDGNGFIYMTYCETPRTTAMLKAPVKTVDDLDSFHWARSQVLAGGDIYLSMYRKGDWLPGVNLSNDGYDSKAPEMPRRQKGNTAVQMIWINPVTSTANDVLFLNFNASSTSGAPPQVVGRQPAANATDVPYYSVHAITVSFNQRMAADSLVQDNIQITGSKSGAVAATLFYSTSLKQLQIDLSHDLQPLEEVTVRLSGRIANEDGVGLDGNANGLAEGAPVDDVTWSYTTQGPDVTPPLLNIGLAQNPVLSRYIDVYVFSQEALKATPTVTVGSTAVTMSIVDANTFLYKGDYKLEAGGVLQISATAADLVGNIGAASRSVSAALVKTNLGGSLSSADGLLEIHIPAGAIAEDEFIMIYKTQAADGSTEPALLKSTDLENSYTISPEQGAGQIRFKASSAIGDAPVIQRRTEQGQWMELPTVQEGDWLLADTDRLGVFRLAASNQVPTLFALTQNYPNPFSSGREITAFQFQLPQREKVQVTIYNILGEKIHTLVQGELNAGVHRLNWNGIDATGSPVAAGLYFYRFSAGHRMLTKKMVILR